MVDTHFQAETPMAKQKTKRAPLRVPRATGSSPQAQWIDGHLRPTAFRAATLIHPVNFNPSLPRRVKNSQWKHRNDNHLIPTSHPTLAERFHALPGELREHVFAILLVRPPRFDLDHSAGCPASTLPAAVEIRPTFSSQSHSCGLFPNAFSFLRNKPVWHDPWRSHYAPPVQHPFKCSNCCDREDRAKPFTRSWRGEDLPCLCVRRQNLNVLLVCKAWYEEAGRVLYARNMFCFTDSYTLHAFLKALPVNRRKQIARLALVTTMPGSQARERSEAAGFSTTERKRLIELFALLANRQRFPALWQLEVGSEYFLETRVLLPLLRTGPK